MLSRTAESLFWMARYMERAENTARFVGGIYQLSLLPGRGSHVASVWETLFPNEAEKQAFLDKHGRFKPEEIVAYVGLDLGNPWSIRSCIRAARENVRATRHVLTTELWETTNQTWFHIRDADLSALDEQGYEAFFEWVKERCHLFRGVVYGTMRRGEAFMFWLLGSFMERADNTARRLAARFENYSSHGPMIGRALDYYEWGRLLRSVNAFKSYREIYGGDIDPRKVAELLILRSDMPRSLRACLDETCVILRQLRPEAECSHHAEELKARLMVTRVDRIFRTGLPKFLYDFMGHVNQLGTQIQRDFLMIR